MHLHSKNKQTNTQTYRSLSVADAHEPRFPSALRLPAAHALLGPGAAGRGGVQHRRAQHRRAQCGVRFSRVHPPVPQKRLVCVDLCCLPHTQQVIFSLHTFCVL